MNRGFGFLLRHLRIGYVSALLFFDFVALSLVAADIIRASSAPFSLFRAMSPSFWNIDFRLAASAALVLGFMLVVLPAGVGVLRVILGSVARLSSVFGARSFLLTSTHMLISLLLCYCFIGFHHLQELSGMEIRATGAAYLFESLFYSAAAAGRTALIVLLSIMASLLIKSVYDMWRDGDKPKEWIRSYTTKASLIDLDGGLYPLHGRHSGNFNAATVAPELRGTYNVSQKAMDSFQKSIPGSFGSREVLRTIREQCEGYLRRVVLDGRSQEFGIEIFSGTSRALEVALERAGKASFIIVSPFEHPAERAVVEWCAPIIGSGVWYMDVMESIVDQPWQKSRERFVSEMREQIVQALSKKSMPLLLISEVWWANGLLIPLAEIVQPLREEFGSALRIVVDGAHVPGNLSGPEGISVADAYVMSAHKWLLSSEPCGILLSKSSHIERQPYDAWLEELPVSTVSFRSIASLRGALVQLESVQLSYLRRRSESLKNFFLARLGDRFKVVGRESGLPSSLMVAIEPALGLRWQFDRVGLERYFADRGVSVAVVPFVRGRVWVRIAFPYFLEAGDVINLCRTLRGAVTFSG